MAHCLDRENEFKVAIKDIENGRYLSHKLSNEVISLFLKKMNLRLITSFQEIMVAFWIGIINVIPPFFLLYQLQVFSYSVVKNEDDIFLY